MMAFDFFSNSSSLKAGFGREGGGVGALSRLTAEKKMKIRVQYDSSLCVYTAFPPGHIFLPFYLFQICTFAQ